MAFKKHKWMQYGRRGNIIEIKIKDESDTVIDTFKCNNPEAFQTIARIIKQKYGWSFKPEISSEESINAQKEIEEERSWLDRDMDW